ncbi:MAG: GNAT family N-acetyltransferase, partial [Saprospiraceae bacterium]|nr:GNAT family N-acetyltransferase [Saprospiraceae bacterium]
CLARIDQRIVGACALINHREGVFELAKMGVDDGYQGRQIGKRLGQAVIDKARSMDGRRLFLESNRKLLPAIGLYRKLGFREVVRRQGKSEYERSDIVMELYL